MKLVDINLLLYAIDSSSSFHSEARKWLEDALSAPETVYFPWIVLLGFVRIGTRNRCLRNRYQSKKLLTMLMNG